MSRFADVADWDGKQERSGKRISTGGKLSEIHIPATEIKYREGERRRATQWIASHAKGAEDCALLLDMLGLSPEEGLNVHSRDGDTDSVADTATGSDQGSS